MNKKSIWNEAQNKPSLIVDDLMDFVGSNYGDQFCEGKSLYDGAYEILLRRGVFKWFTVRRKLIRLKNEWKNKITNSISKQKNLNATYFNFETTWIDGVAYERGYRKALEDCRKEIRALCHSDRWQCPDNDSRAREWFEKRSKNVKD